MNKQIEEIEKYCGDCKAWSGTDCTRNPITQNCLKEIEEMVRIISPCSKLNCDDCVKTKRTCIDYFIAQKLYNAGYRKIPENAVVFIPTEEQYVLLSKKEHEELKKGIKTYNYTAMFNSGQEERIRQLEERLCFVYEQARKETAEKFAKLAKERKIEMGTDGHSYCMVFVEDIDEICKEITEE